MTKTPGRRLEDLEQVFSPEPQPEKADFHLPHIIDFVIGKEYLNRPLLYPRQATLLKLIFLEDCLLTAYDHDVLREWGEGQGEGLEAGGQYGVASDVLERIALNKATGRRWFRTVVNASGRRGSKGYIGALSLAYVLWDFLGSSSPEERFAIAHGKTLSIPNFAVNGAQARDVFHRDFVDVVTAAPCFAPYIAERKSERVMFWSVRQLEQEVSLRGRPAFEVVARESTDAAARGYASPAQVYDEMAHAVATGSARSAEDMYVAASPAQSQFGVDVFAYLASSPRHKTGVFYELHEQGLTVDGFGRPEHPEILSLQFSSWELFRDWDRWESIPLYPGGPTSAPINRAVISEDDPELERIRKTNPEMYRVEYLGQWADVLMQYLASHMVLAMSDPFNGRTLEMNYGRRSSSDDYVFHVDLGLVGDNAALVIGHSEQIEGDGVHFVMDLEKVWEPSDFPDGVIHLDTIETELRALMISFRPTRLTFDQFQSAQMIQHLREHAQSNRLRTYIDVIPSNRTRSREVGETFKMTLYDGRVHAPRFQLAEDELLFLQDDGIKIDHPSTGPVTSNDVAVCLFEVVAALTELTYDPGRLFRSVGMRAMKYYRTDEDVFGALSAFGGSREPRYQRLKGGTTSKPPKRLPWF